MKIKKGFTLHQVANGYIIMHTRATYLTEHYEVDALTADRDAARLINDWLEAGVIER